MSYLLVRPYHHWLHCLPADNDLCAGWSQLREPEENLSEGRLKLVQRLAEADKRGALALVQRTLSVMCDYFNHLARAVAIECSSQSEAKGCWLMLATIFVYGSVGADVEMKFVRKKLTEVVSRCLEHEPATEPLPIVCGVCSSISTRIQETAACSQCLTSCHP